MKHTWVTENCKEPTDKGSSIDNETTDAEPTKQRTKYCLRSSNSKHEPPSVYHNIIQYEFKANNLAESSWHI